MSDWVPVYDESNQGYYYYNQITGESTWETPPGYTNTVDSTPQLPAGWIAVTEEGSGSIYYYNEQTGESSWDVPAAPAAAYEITTTITADTHSVTEVVQSSSNATLPEGWKEGFDTDSGKVYYYNETTGETSWELPQSALSISTSFPSSTTEITSNYTEFSSPTKATADSTSEWVEHIDSSGKVFYENTVTGHTQWDSPQKQAQTPSHKGNWKLLLYITFLTGFL